MYNTPPQYHVRGAAINVILKGYKPGEGGLQGEISGNYVQADKAGIADDAVSIVVPDATVYLPLEELIDFEQEIERLTKEEARLTKEIARSNGMLNNEKFVSKAPAAKVQEERDKLETYQQMMAQVKERLEGLKAKQS